MGRSVLCFCAYNVESNLHYSPRLNSLVLQECIKVLLMRIRSDCLLDLHNLSKMRSVTLIVKKGKGRPKDFGEALLGCKLLL